MVLTKVCQNRTDFFKGIIWFRLPIPSDSLNWPEETLAAIINQEPLESRLEVTTSPSADGATNVSIVNHGNLTIPLPTQIPLTLDAEDILAAGGSANWLYEKGVFVRRAESRLFRTTKTHLAPGQTQILGWYRIHAGF